MYPNHNFYKIYCFIALYLYTITNVFSQNLLPKEDDYYKIVTLPIPEGVAMEVGGLVTLPNGNVVASTRRGDVWLVENPYMPNGTLPNYKKFATGLHEALGLAYKNAAFYVAQRGELTKLIDTNGDNKADKYESIYSVPISGHYHEYTFGPIMADDGSMYITGNVAFGDIEWWRGESRSPWRGWTMKISEDGKMEPWATGMRSPCGIGMIDGQFFYGDNQGDWMGSGFITAVNKGDFTGHPAGLRWAKLPESPVKVSDKDIYARVDGRFAKAGEAPTKPENIENETPKPLFEVAKDFPNTIKTPAVWLPHGILGISTSEIVVDKTNGNFGPFTGQAFVGDQGQSKIARVFLEKVNGTWQGAAFNFKEGFQSGVLRMSWGNDGSMFVGQTNRGWGSTGKDPFGLQRLVWTGKIPFEIKTIKAMPDGFELEFTQPVDKTSASNPENYEITGFIYKYHPVYGSPVVNDKKCFINGVVISEDGLKVRLEVNDLREKYIHEIKAEGVKAAASNYPLLHNTGYYTLNVIPNGNKLNLPKRAITQTMHTMQHDNMVSKPEKKRKKSKKTPSTNVLSKRITVMPTDWAKPEQIISLGTTPGLKYDKGEIRVKAASKIQWTFNNNDDMPHNCVIVNPNSADEVGNIAYKMGLKGEAKSYIPDNNNVLFHSRLVGPGASDTIYFIAPSTPGIYTIVCTVPGHANVMRSKLIVE